MLLLCKSVTAIFVFSWFWRLRKLKEGENNAVFFRLQKSLTKTVGLSLEKIHIHNLRRTAAVSERRSGVAGAGHLHFIRIRTDARKRFSVHANRQSADRAEREIQNLD